MPHDGGRAIWLLGRFWQPYCDLAKLPRKESVISEHATWIFRAAPFVAFSCYRTVFVIVPIITDGQLPLAFLADLIGGAFVLMLASFSITLAALDTASPSRGLGASRTTWVGSLAERSLILVKWGSWMKTGATAMNCPRDLRRVTS